MILLNSRKIAIAPSTLLIPEYIDDEFKKRITKYKGIRNYFEYLLNTYEKIAKDVMPICNSTKCEYQKKFQKLQRYSFRPMNQDWIRLGLLADYLGLSKTHLFVFLVLLDILKWWKVMENKVLKKFEFVGRPTNPIQVQLTQTIYFKSKDKNYSREFQYF